MQFTLGYLKWRGFSATTEKMMVYKIINYKKPEQQTTEDSFLLPKHKKKPKKTEQTKKNQKEKKRQKNK